MSLGEQFKIPYKRNFVASFWNKNLFANAQQAKASSSRWPKNLSQKIKILIFWNKFSDNFLKIFVP